MWAICLGKLYLMNESLVDKHSLKLKFLQVTCVVTDWKRDKMVTGDRKGNVRVWDLKKVRFSTV